MVAFKVQEETRVRVIGDEVRYGKSIRILGEGGERTWERVGKELGRSKNKRKLKAGNTKDQGLDGSQWTKDTAPAR